MFGKVTRKITKSGGLLLAIVLAAVVGGTTTAVVMAAIPSSSGTISACYGKIAGTLRVIDAESGKTCNGLENPLSWGSGGGHQIAYAALNSDNTLNTSYSSGVSGAKFVPLDPDDPTTGSVCFEVNFTPKIMLFAPGSLATQNLATAVSGYDPDGRVSAICGSGYNAVVTSVQTSLESTYSFSFSN